MKTNEKLELDTTWGRAVCYARKLVEVTGFTHFIGFDDNGDVSVQGTFWEGARGRVTANGIGYNGVPSRRDLLSDAAIRLPEAQIDGPTGVPV